jgi:excisionase family DNA binding protein
MGSEIHWLTVREAAGRARVGPKTIYRAVRATHLRAARIGGRRELRFLETWIDKWLLGEQNQHVDGRLVLVDQSRSLVDMSAASRTSRDL